MLPILATIGAGLAWFAGTAGQLVFWGAGIAVGFWVGRKITNSWDNYGANRTALKFWNRRTKEDEQVAAAAAIIPNPA